MRIEKTDFGQTSAGKAVGCYTLTATDGAYVKIIELGGIVQALCVPDRQGKLLDVVLGYDTVAEYEANLCYFGALIGRCANRIGNSRFVLGGKEYRLQANDVGGNHLHSGSSGFHRRLWQSRVEGDVLVLTYASPDGEGGYPGNVQVQVRYSFDDNHALTIDYQATSDTDTLINLTNHSYFNLGGHNSGDILNHRLQMAAEHYTPIDQNGLTQQQLWPVKNTPFDFRRYKPIGLHIDSDDLQIWYGKGYDHNFMLDSPTKGPVAQVYSPITGIWLRLHTTQPGIHFYTGNSIFDQKGKGEVQYSARSGFCLETQHVPNAVNYTLFEKPILLKGQTYRQTSVYQFDTKANEG